MPEDMRILTSERALEDHDVLKDCGVENNQVLFLVFKNEDNNWEEVNVFKPVYECTEEDGSVKLPQSLVSYLDDLKPRNNS